MGKLAKRLFKLFFTLAFLYGIYVAGTITYATMTEFRPKELVPISIENPNYNNIRDSVLTFLSWNIGYAGLGAEEDFFYDGGKSVRAPENRAKSYLSGIAKYLKENSSVDFILLQEVDSSARRSYNTNQYKALKTVLDGHAAMYAFNYKVRYVPAPFERPWDRMGHVHSGLASFTKYQPEKAKRYQFPGNFDWPKRVFMLKRGFIFKRFKLSNGKDLVVINTHNSAFDDGSLRSLQLEYLRSIAEDEFSNGHYVVIGGDWNQVPPGLALDKFTKGQEEIHESRKAMTGGVFKENWTWAFDPEKPSNRDLDREWNPEKTDAFVVDYFLLSPNIELLNVETKDLEFRHSDHQPVFMKIKLKDE